MTGPETEEAVRRQLRAAADDLLVDAPPFERISRRSRRLGRRRTAAVVTSVVVAVGVAAAGVAGLAGLSTHSSPVPGETGKSSIEPSPLEVQRVPLGNGDVRSLRFADGELWAATTSGAGANQIIRLDPQTGAVVGEPIDVEGPLLGGFAVGGGSVWAAEAVLTGSSWDKEPGTLFRFDASTGAPTGQVTVGRHPSDVLLGGGFVWVTNVGDDTVTKVDPVTDMVLATIPVAHGPERLEFGFGTLWIQSDFQQVVLQRLDPSSDRIVATTPDVSIEAIGDGVVWVQGPGRPKGQAVLQLDPATNGFVGRPFGLDIAPAEIVAGEGQVWLGKWFDDGPSSPESREIIPSGGFRFSRFDPLAGELVGPSVQLGDGPVDGAIGGGALWLPLPGQHALVRVSLRPSTPSGMGGSPALGSGLRGSTPSAAAPEVLDREVTWRGWAFDPPAPGFVPVVSAGQAVEAASHQQDLGGTTGIQPTLMLLTLQARPGRGGPLTFVKVPVWDIEVDGICEAQDHPNLASPGGVVPSLDPCSIHETQVFVHATTGKVVLQAFGTWR